METETHNFNERNRNRMYEPEQLYDVLNALIEYPSIFSMLDENLANFLEDEGLFSLERFEVTELGIAFVKSDNKVA